MKPPQLSAFGDLALATGAEFKLYFPHIIKILVGAAEVTGDVRARILALVGWTRVVCLPFELSILSLHCHFLVLVHDVDE